MTSDEPVSLDRVAIVGAGLIGTSIGLAAARVGCTVTAWDTDAETLRAATRTGAMVAAASFDEAVHDAQVVVVATPIAAIAERVEAALAAAPRAVVTDVGSIKAPLVAEVAARADDAHRHRFVPGHPMGGSERSGPDHASSSLVDGIVWVITPTDVSDGSLVDALEGWIARLGSRPVRMPPERHDRLVAFVSHLPQVASTALMALAATEESDEPEILLLAAGGFRDLTRLASSNPALWSEILLANGGQIAAAIDLYVARLTSLRDEILAGRAADVEATFAGAKRARLKLAAKPQVRAGVAVLQVTVPDRPGALAELTSGLADGGVNIEDLQIVHSPEGGRGTVHLTVAAGAAEEAVRVLSTQGSDPIRIA